MPTPVDPLVIRSSGIVILGGKVDYFRDSLSFNFTRPGFNIETDMFGPISTRAQGLPMVEISYTPVGMMKNFAAHFPYGPHNLVVASSVGKSIFTLANSAITIATVAGDVWTFARGAVYKSPSLFLSPRKTIFGPKTMRALTRVDIPATTAGALVAVTQAAFADISFDPTSIINDMYVAALGTRGAPFNAMGAREGFTIEPEYQMDDAQDDYVGTADTKLTGIRWKCSFAPNNLTAAQTYSLANWDGPNAVLPGESLAQGIGAGAEDLVIDGTNTVFTLHAVGNEKGTHGIGTKVDRNGTFSYVQEWPFTNGVPQPLITLPNL